MSKMIKKLLGFAVVVFTATTMCASDKSLDPVGFFVDPLVGTTAAAKTDDTNDAAPVSHAKVIRDGKEYEARVGGQVYLGDVIKTDAMGGIQIAFMDSSAIRLFEATEFIIENAPLLPENAKASSAARAQPELTLTYGHAALKASSLAPDTTTATTDTSFSVGIANLVNLGVGKKGKISSSTLAFIDIIVTPNANGVGFTSNIAVLKGSATLTPAAGNAVNLSYLGTALLKLNTDVAGAGPTATTINTGNLTAAQITALAANSVTDTNVSVGKNNTVTISSAIKHVDGSITVESLTEVNGLLSKEKWTTEDSANKVIATWSETTKGVALTRSFNGFALKTSVKLSGDTGSGKATLKGPNKASYSGTATVNAKTGVVTFVSTPAKDGSTVTYTFDPTAIGGPTNTLINVTKAGVATETQIVYNPASGVQTSITETGTIVNGVFVGNPATIVSTSTNVGASPITATTPDGHAIDPNLPPATQ